MMSGDFLLAPIITPYAINKYLRLNHMEDGNMSLI